MPSVLITTTKSVPLSWRTCSAYGCRMADGFASGAVNADRTRGDAATLRATASTRSPVVSWLRSRACRYAAAPPASTTTATTTTCSAKSWRARLHARGCRRGLIAPLCGLMSFRAVWRHSVRSDESVAGERNEHNVDGDWQRGEPHEQSIASHRRYILSSSGAALLPGSMPPGPPSSAQRAPRDKTHWLYIAVIVAVALGIAVGFAFPGKDGLAVQFKPLGTGFVNLIKMIITPIIFCTIVVGIGSVRKAASVGKVGGLALGYFTLTST